MPECFTWLHLTDLHTGMDNQGWLWPDIKERFFEDLKKLCEKTGPLDLVLFTGDLTQKGTEEEFQKVDTILNELWAVLQESGSEPKFLAVPGNHDLLRPAGDDDPVLLLLTQWNEQPKVRERFWQDTKSIYHQIIVESFNNYKNWWNRLRIKPDNINEGLLPGDFSATIEKKTAKLGLVGLNTSFLQLTSDDYEGKLALHGRQFHKVCADSGPDWIKQHHACLFLTHHPVSWLNKESQQQVNEHIMAYGRFAVHLCGHMHETVYRDISESGVEARRIWQGRSLFGLEDFGEKKEKREHGYSIGKIELVETQGKLFFFPRQALPIGGQREIKSDISVKLIDELYTIPNTFDLHQSYAEPSNLEMLPPEIPSEECDLENSSSAVRKKIFIICADEDNDIAQRIYNDLKLLGCKPWLTVNDVKIGQNPYQMFRSVMDESDYVLALLSENSLNQRGIAQKQLKKALDLFEEFPTETIFLIPVQLDDTKPQDEVLKNLKSADFCFSYEEGFKQIIQAIRPIIPSSPKDDIEFVNRIQEMKYITDIDCPQYLLIQAPKGYGKTRLIEVAQKKLEEQGWYSISIGLPRKKPVTIKDISHRILQHIGIDKSKTIDLTSAEKYGNELSGYIINILGRENTTPLKMLLIIDGTESVENDVLKALCNAFIVTLKEKLDMYRIKFRLILTRCNTTTLEPNELDIPLTYYCLSSFEYSSVLETINIYASSKTGMKISQEYRKIFTSYLMYYTGGHPGCMIQILKIDFANISKKLLKKVIRENEKKYYKAILKPVINNIVGYISSSELQSIFIRLSVVRKFNARFIRFCIEKQLIQSNKNEYELEDLLLRTYLVNREKGFLKDGITRRLLAIHLYQTYPDIFMKICKKSIAFYEKRLEDPKEFSPHIIVIELIFQKMQYQFYKQEIDKKSLFKSVDEILDNILKIYDPVPLLENLIESLKKDNEFRFMFNYMLKGSSIYNDHKPYNELTRKLNDIKNEMRR